jgi:hypothetical protein
MAEIEKRYRSSTASRSAAVLPSICSANRKAHRRLDCAAIDDAEAKIRPSHPRCAGELKKICVRTLATAAAVGEDENINLVGREKVFAAPTRPLI